MTPTIPGESLAPWRLLSLYSNAEHRRASMRSSWTDPSAAYITLKGGRLTGHQTHGHLDIGDFVMDALGQRWVGELCQANYLGTDYFTSEAQTASQSPSFILSFLTDWRIDLSPVLQLDGSGTEPVPRDKTPSSSTRPTSSSLVTLRELSVPRESLRTR